MATLQAASSLIRKHHIAGVVVVGCIWLALAGWLSSRTTVPGSPDEAANAFFVDQVALTGSPEAPFVLTADQASYWHPRSMVVDATSFKPGSFTGLILVGGWLERVTFDGAHRLLTPLAAVFGLWAFFLILRRFWPVSWSLLGAVLVGFHPAWFQFQTLPDYHNGIFASLLVVAGWRLMKLWDDGRMRNVLWFGCAFGAALFFRPVEVLWTAPLVAVVLGAQRKWGALAIAAGVTLILQLPWLVTNQSLYGSWLSSGYASAGAVDLLSASTEGGLETPRLLTPPGGWSWNWLHSVWHYLFLLVPAWSAAAAIAFFFYVRRISHRPLKLLKISLVTLPLLFVVLYYGSWDLYPLETPVTVGSLASYVRYWLPLYVPMAVGVLWLLKRLAASWAIIVVGLCLLLSQVGTIIWHENSGLKARFEQIRSLESKRQAVLERTSAEAAIVAGHLDKVLFPDRLVAFRLPESDPDWQSFIGLQAERPVFLYVTPRQYSLTRVNSQLARYGLVIIAKHGIAGDELWEVGKL